LAALIDEASKPSAATPELLVVVVGAGTVVVEVEDGGAGVVVGLVKDVVVDEVVVVDEIVVNAGEPATEAVAQSPLTRAKEEIDAAAALTRRGVLICRSWWAWGAMSSLVTRRAT
jgi:hypothetical protein